MRLLMATNRRQPDGQLPPHSGRPPSLTAGANFDPFRTFKMDTASNSQELRCGILRSAKASHSENDLQFNAISVRLPPSEILFPARPLFASSLLTSVQHLRSHGGAHAEAFKRGRTYFI